MVHILKTLKISISYLLSVVAAFLMPIVPLILMVGIAIAVDTVFGILRALKIKEKLSCKAFSRIISKMVLYNSALILFFCIDTFILHDVMLAFTAVPFVLTKIVAFTLLMTEITSINENYTVISGVNLWKKFKEILMRGKEIKKLVSDLSEDEKDKGES